MSRTACGLPSRPAPASRRPTARKTVDLQRDVLETAGVDEVDVYHDLAAGVRDDPAGLDSSPCARVALVVWKLDRLGRNLARLVDTVQDLSARGVGVLASDEGAVDTTTAGGRLVFGVFAALADVSRDVPTRAAGRCVAPVHHELPRPDAGRPPFRRCGVGGRLGTAAPSRWRGITTFATSAERTSPA